MVRLKRQKVGLKIVHNISNIIIVSTVWSGPVFSELSTDMMEGTTTLQEAEESYRRFYKLVENFLSVN